MDQYTNNFLDKGFATPRQILQLTELDLEALGIGPLGHRKKIYKAIKNTKAQVRTIALIRILFTSKKYNWNPIKIKFGKLIDKQIGK